MLNLHIYEHCPYCTKARYIFGVKKLDVNINYILNDDVEGPTKMIGQKMVPILEYESSKFMGESIDIIRFIDEKYDKKLIFWQQIDQIEKILAEAKQYIYKLSMPRWAESNMPEFQTKDAKNYFIKKKTQYIGDFQEHLSNTANLLNNLAPLMQMIEELIDDSYFNIEKINISHINLFAMLKALTIIEDIVFLEKTNQFLNFHSKAALIELEFGKYQKSS